MNVSARAGAILLFIVSTAFAVGSLGGEPVAAGRPPSSSDGPKAGLSLSADPDGRKAVTAGAEAAGLPRIGFSDTVIYFETVRNGSSPPGQGFDLLNTSEVGTLDWRLEADRYFIGAGPLSGKSNSTRIFVWVLASTDLLVGVHPAHLIVTSTNAVNSPETVFVQVKILCPIQVTGDVTGDGAVSQGDIVYLVNHVLKGGPAPVPLPQAGDVNCDRNVGLADVIFLVNYVLKGGVAPCDACILL